MRENDPTLMKRDYEAYQKAYAGCFAAFPKKLNELLSKKLVYGRFSATPKGCAAAKAGNIYTNDLAELQKLGYVRAEGLRYEDFLPVSAAGIFASNLGQYGTKSTATTKPTYTADKLEEIMNRKIVDTTATYEAVQAASLVKSYADLDLLGKIPVEQRQQWERASSLIV
jgi:uncharacterized glyoxalase superfamily metalloenzyme YdcJ